MLDNVDILARCIYSREGDIKYIPQPSLVEDIRYIENQCTSKKIESGYTPHCFLRIIKTLREYPDAPELFIVTRKIAREIDFRETPSDLAFLIHDAMRSVYGPDFIGNPRQCSRIAFAMDMPKDYKGNETLATNCEGVKDMSITYDWRRIAACRFKKRGPVFST